MEHDRDTVDRFVSAWGALGRLWGIPPTTARIQALLLATDRPLSLDEITERLDVSKGGASDRLKELRSWSVVRRVKARGDRRDYYVADDDVWKAFVGMIRARKRTEFDPAAAAVRNALGGLREDRSPAPPMVARLRQMEDILDALDGLGERLLSAGPATRAVLRFLAGTPRRS